MSSGEPLGGAGESVALRAAYAFCREVARREAKNFYWAFRVLPQHKSDAMCAVYAFMRKADDLADDTAMGLEERRAAMAAWTGAWREARAGGATEDPVFVALRDTQRRFGIADELLEKLVAGTTMDLEERLPGVRRMTAAAGADGVAAELDVYETFEDLYRYCYLVASVVGLVCIRIFGYEDARAELLAEHTGIAFQLTNIVRDVREDAANGRVYLPLDDMERARTSLESVLLACGSGQAGADVRGLLEMEIARAQEYYRAGDALIPMLHADSQAAMRVLLTIYRRLLERIAARPEAVFAGRVSVPTLTKLGILGGGMLQASLLRRGKR